MTKSYILKELLKTGKYKMCEQLEAYVNLVWNNLKNNPHKTKDLEKHHIVPKAVCRELGLHSDYNEHNTVFMNHDNHTEAHNLLSMAAINIDYARQARGCASVKSSTVEKHLRQ